MYAYLIIGIELAILYSVFWYVFIREPKPYKVKGDLWGTYAQLSDVDHSSSVDREWLENNIEILKSLQNHTWTNKTQVTAPMKPIENTKQYGWVVRDRDAEAGAVAKLFGKLRDSVEVMSVKVP